MPDFSLQIKWTYVGHVRRHPLSRHSNPSGHGVTRSHDSFRTTHPTSGSPTSPFLQLHLVVWFSMVQSALVPQAVADSQGLTHFLLMQVSLLRHSLSVRHPSMHVIPEQISPSLHSTSFRQVCSQSPLSHNSFLKQSPFEPHIFLHILRSQVKLWPQLLFSIQITGSRTHPTRAVGFGIMPAGQVQWLVWLTTLQRLWRPQVSGRQILEHFWCWQDSSPEQSSFDRQPTVQVLLRQIWLRKQSLSRWQVTENRYEWFVNH